MALIYDGAGSAFFPIQRPVGLVGQNPWVVFVKFFPVQQNDIRLRGSLFVFRNLSGTALAEFFAYEEFRFGNDRNGRIIRWGSATNDLVSLVPYYDFPRIQIWTEGAGLA